MDVVNVSDFKLNKRPQIMERGVKIEFSKPPKTVRKNIEKIKKIRKEGDMKVMVNRDTERFIVIVFASREEKNRFLEALNLPHDERYLLAQTVEDFLAKKLIPLGIKSGHPRRTGATG